jgi:hypothetical protein
MSQTDLLSMSRNTCLANIQLSTGKLAELARVTEEG